VSDIDTAAADSLKALDTKRPIREADIGGFGLLLSLNPIFPDLAEGKAFPNFR
jgi:hypothetical protein